LRGLCDPVLVIANDLTPYLQLRATLVQDAICNQGPLGGIYTALLFSPHPWVLAKATDMPLLVADLAQLMLTRREGVDVVIPVQNDRYEPLLALYSRRCLPIVAAALEKGERQIISFFPKVRVRELTEAEWRTVDPDGLSFSNINTPENLEQLRWI
jgi:molybdenum cofactor guanylyltransferase